MVSILYVATTQTIVFIGRMGTHKQGPQRSLGHPHRTPVVVVAWLPLCSYSIKEHKGPVRRTWLRIGVGVEKKELGVDSQGNLLCFLSPESDGFDGI